MSNWEEEYARDASSFLNPASGTSGASGSSRPRYADSNALGLGLADRDDEDVPMGGVDGDAGEAMDPTSMAIREIIEEGSAEANTPLQQLIRHWMNERHAPDILPAQEELLSGLLDHLRLQSRNVQILRDDPRTSESEHFRIMLVQTEIERVKFIIRSYIRTRLYKIERYARFITSDADVQTRITASEREHASRHAKLTEQHLYLSVLQSLPEAQSHLDDTPVFYPSMVTQPDKTRPVFVHALQECPPIRLPDGNSMTMKKGHIVLTQYQVVEHLVARGEAELV
ncbi:hypothetical protein CC1G_04745 [Coprinopsis cinerea okayama7|uniref:DNA replication complex GINS protein SLD5 n=1 Tax=Coprinopsis cinerea (strain Okayama-7 / 130 / ATCC MYA-4618 / FGSC 9003) TaxID=240176 RepID=A8P2E6_COPC7|nr:hypothetical protein CC1G_04745 [Coprinopsis cinerea okayama7\|eukprot:XP_001838301.1 hypothetical protein CC1G_04745 [Coprinopsis cinerea okayama7\